MWLIERSTTSSISFYRAKSYEGPAKDYEFSRGSMEDHWRAGYYDVVRTLRHPGVVERPTNHEGVLTSTSPQTAVSKELSSASR